ncbi:ATP-binding response regulator [Usitatibacter palustris]|uniref:histidine kinase n=1 Tax=Usitatibacter palustris TaxID=2732487 RepID=A0A6M4H7J8_9PROT|nr:response regulator [Usitatibacter palustris]QJR13967.1 Sensor histidine kinase RcsC [Usitatibacter palustris]
MVEAVTDHPPGSAAILAVDDRPDKILVLRTVLEELGQEVVSVSSGQEALKEILERDFAVILLDINMPGLDGFETAELIRKRKRSAHTPIIFMTAYADEMHAIRAYKLGAVDFILTPFAPEVLRAKVRVFVELHLMAEAVRNAADQRVALAREQALRGAAEEAVRRSAFLAEGGRLLASSLEAEMLARDFVHFAVPYLGSLALLALVDDQGRIMRTEVAWSDPEMTTGRKARSVLRVLDAPFEETIARALESGKSEVATTAIGEDGLHIERIEGGTQEALAMSFRPQAIVVHPLRARGRTLGALAIALAPPRARFSAAELALGDDIAGRVAIAIDNAMLYRQVRDNDRRKDEFLAMLAHELRSPLAPIRNAIEVMRAMGPSEERWPWARDIIDRQSKQLVRLVDDLLDVSRITSGKIQLRTEDVDVASVLQSAVETSRPLIEERRHELAMTLPDRPLAVRGDAARIAQTLANLLNNAAKYTSPGGRIAVSAGAEGNEVVFKVSDTGLGIPAPMLDGIFDLFSQLDHSLDRSQGGLGIGLTLVKRLVEAQGGTVGAKSEGLNCGSEFSIRLPLSAGVPRAQQASKSSAPTPRRRILVVEDHADTAQTLATLVALDGHEVRAVHDGPAALEMAPGYLPEVILIDIGLPGMDGFEVARRMRALAQTRASLLVAVTGYGQERDRRMALAAGFDEHLVKPVNVQALCAVIREKRHAAEVT